jgi:pimeloyl-ACP methyl ester carboxylesterase
MGNMEIRIDDLNINYKITGEGEKTFVILQGWGTDCNIYDSVARTVLGMEGSPYKVVQFDFPGFGGSDEPKAPWDVDGYTDFFVAFMKAINVKNAVLYGHSFGGRVIIKLFGRENLPFEIERVILNDAAGIMPKRSPKQLRKIRRYKILKTILLSKPIHALFPDMIDYWKGQQGSADYRAASPMMKQVLVKAVNEDLTDGLSKINKDTLLIWGDKDTATPIGDAHIMEEKIPNAGLAVIEGTGHYSFLENAPLFNSILTTYLKNC